VTRAGRSVGDFIDAEDRRGKVIYLRHDGEYGVVEPE
jgi:hypothetical protein